MQPENRQSKTRRPQSGEEAMTPERATRRTTIAAFLGAAVAAVAAALNSTKATAAPGDPVILGQNNESDALTTISGPVKLTAGELPNNGITLDAAIEYVNCDTVVVSEATHVACGIAWRPGQSALIATLNDVQPGLRLVAAVLGPDTGSVTIHLSRQPDSPVRVSILIMDSMHTISRC
jgi:hypothetical protein